MSLVKTFDPIIDVIHGVAVVDPYRWLEDRSLPETDTWLLRQQELCDRYFASCPSLPELERRVEEYLNVEVVDQPARVGNRYFYRKRRKNEEQGGLYVRDGARGTERLLVAASAEEKYTSFAIYRISPDGGVLAYERKCGGEDRKEIRFVDVNQGTSLPDCIASGYSRGLAFVSSGYFYCHDRDDGSNEHTVRYHAFGSGETDPIVFRCARTPGSRVVSMGNSCRLGVIWSRPGSTEATADFWISDTGESPTWTEVFREKNLPYIPILCGDRILILAATISKCTQVIELATNGQELRTVVPEKHVPIRHLAITRNRIIVSYEERGVTTAEIWDFDGHQVGYITLPKNGTIRLLPVQEQNSDSVFYSFESFDTSPTIYEHIVSSNSSVLFHQRESGRTHPNDYCVRGTTATSADGTAIPITLVSRYSGQFPDSSPVIMTSYGGFGISATPQFSVLVAIMIELGAIFALPHIRGGGDLGNEWHNAGRARNRQAAFDDFIASAEWLFRRGVTNPSRLAIFGGSNSGLLVGAAMTQRPELFAAVLCIAPLLDMVRYEEFDQAVKWRREYGTVRDPDDFRVLVGYSPYHHIADGVNYPPTLFVSGDKDDRCNPAHTRKMAASLQNRPEQTSPVILDYCGERGHSPVLPLSVRIQALARRLAFLCRELRVTVHQGVLNETSHY